MARRRLQQKGDPYKQGGWWKLRWKKDVVLADGTTKRAWSKSVTIGPAPDNPLGLRALTKKEALRSGWDNYLSRLDQQLRTPQSVMTVGEFVERYFRPGHVDLLKDKLNTISRLERWVLPVLGEAQLRDVRRRDAQAAVSAVLNAGRSVQLALHVKNLISGIFRHAEAEECYSGVNPAKHVKLPQMVRKERHALTFEQARGLLRAVAERYRTLVLFALLTSLNIAEIIGLRWRYLNLTDDWRSLDGEALEPWCFHVRWQWSTGGYTTLKATARRRNIPIPRVLATALLVMQNCGQATEPDDPVFVSSTGRPLDAHNILNRHLKPTGRELGMPWLCWHALRHTTATWLDQGGAGMADRMAILGHSQARTTMLYTHGDQERRRQFLEEMATRLTGDDGGTVQ